MCGAWCRLVVVCYFCYSSECSGVFVTKNKMQRKEKIAAAVKESYIWKRMKIEIVGDYRRWKSLPATTVAYIEAGIRNTGSERLNAENVEKVMKCERTYPLTHILNGLIVFELKIAENYASIWYDKCVRVHSSDARSQICICLAISQSYIDILCTYTTAANDTFSNGDPWQSC